MIDLRREIAEALLQRFELLEELHGTRDAQRRVVLKAANGACNELKRSKGSLAMFFICLCEPSVRK